MSLVDVPIQHGCKIKLPAGHLDAALLRYATVGVSAGRHARVLARYPAVTPQFVEVELDGSHFVTLPISLAKGVEVELLG
jgi:hypothetical protein